MNEQSSPSQNRWLILALVLAVECMDLLDGTIVNVATPSIRADLGSSLAAVQWIAGGDALTFAVGLVTGGRPGGTYRPPPPFPPRRGRLPPPPPPGRGPGPAPEAGGVPPPPGR